MIALLLVALAGAPDQGSAKYFDDNCAMCHEIGGPPGGGAPDLKGVTARRARTWLVQFILNPEELAANDPDAAALVKQYDGVVMPHTDGITADIAEALLQFIAEKSGGAAPVPTAPAAAARTATAADVAAGRALYEGRRALAARGPACVSCHQLESVGGLGGGTLGPDLTRVHQRLGGDRALNAWLGNPPTVVMRAVFRTRPLATEEAFALTALLADESATHAAAPPHTRRFVAMGIGVALAALVVMAVLWSRRLTSVRRPLVAAARTRAGDER